MSRRPGTGAPNLEAHLKADREATPGPEPWVTRWTEFRDEEDPGLSGDGPQLLAAERPMEVVAVPLRTAFGVTVGSGLWRQPGMVDAIRAIPGIGRVSLSPIGGTLGPGGQEWLHLMLVARPPDPFPRPLDSLMALTTGLLQAPLRPSGLRLVGGRIDRAWCPGFSDLAVDGRKLAGIGFKLTRELALVRVIVGLRRPPPERLAPLAASHQVAGFELDPEALSWLGDLLRMPDISADQAVRLLASASAPEPEKIDP